MSTTSMPPLWNELAKTRQMAGKSILGALFFYLATFTQLFAQCDCVTTGNCPVPIQDNGIYSGYLDVTVNGANDLGVNPLTSVCVTITHTWIGDLSISLTSPSGVEYLIMADAGNNYGECGTQQDNAEICIVPGTNHPLTNNTEYTCNSAPCSVGTCCLNGNWTVPCGGVTSPITGVPTAPNCNLNDFNIPGQPANGTWTISILDVCNQDIGNLENFSLTFLNGQACYACEADAGELDSLIIKSCAGDPSLDLSLPPIYDPDGPLFGEDSTIYEYIYLLVQNGVILGTMTSPDLTSQPPGHYEIYGLSYLIIHGSQVPSLIGMNINSVIADLGSSTASFCADISENAVPVTILPPIPTTNVNKTVCQGACVTVGGQQYCTTTDQIIHLNSWAGCDSTVHLVLNVLHPVATITPATPPAITCTVSSVALSASTSGPGTLAYAWSGPAGFAGSTQPGISATIPGTYTVTVSDNSISPACTSTASVTVPDGRVLPDLALNGLPPSICAGESFDLVNVQIQDLNGTGAIITIHSGTPATSANQLADTNVSPTTSTTYYYKATKGNCTDEIGVLLTVKPVPTANFTATPVSCLPDGVTVTYTGSASPSATYNWFFDGGTATPGTGAGPHQVVFPFAGPKSITLIVTENGCPSSVFIQNITVENPLAQPVINCQATTTSILFSWGNVAGSTGYNVVSSIPGTQVSPTSYQVTGLMPGQAVDISVEAIGTNSCGNSTAQTTCNAANCPTVTVTPTPVSDICRDASTAPFNLTGTVTGGNGTGTLTWSGTGIVDAAAGTFDPKQASIGANTITATYSEGPCTTSSDLTIYVFQTPTASFTAPSSVCIGNAATINFTGSIGSGQTYAWDFGGGTATPGTGAGPHTVTFATGGTKTVTLTVTENGCSSSVFIQNITVDNPLAQPVVTCQTTPSSIVFSWGNLAGSTGYNVTSSVSGTQLTPTSYEVTGLMPSQSVDITVEAISSNACGNSSAQATCVTDPCPNVTVAPSPVSDICRGASTAPFNLTATVTGGNGTGTLTWSGSGIVNATAGTFDPNQAAVGANIITATYAEGVCVTSSALTINVYQTPTASITATQSVCTGTAATVGFTGSTGTGLTYTWDFDGGVASPGTGAGPQQVTWTTPGLHTVSVFDENSNGCTSSVAIADVQVDVPLAQPIIDCSATLQSVTFSWGAVAGAMSYNVNVATGQSATLLTPTSYIINGLSPGEAVSVQVTAVSSNACGNSSATIDCAATPCPLVTLTIDPVADICRNSNTQPIQLVANMTGGSPTGTLEWFGQGVSFSGLFNPNQANLGANTITAIYTDGPCNYTQDIIINVNQAPTGGFASPAKACVGSAAVVNFNGSNQPGMTYTWDFGGGSALPGTGPGPHNVTWSTPGVKLVTLTVANSQGCISPIYMGMVDVSAPIAPPQITCGNTTTSSIEFTWSSVPGATSYNVTTSTGQSGTQTSPTTYLVTGLQPSEQVCVTVTAVSGNTCPSTTAQLCCIAKPCPNITVDITPVPDFCLGASNPIQLSATVTGGDGSGVGTWSGLGIINASTGTFSPSAAGFGTHIIQYSYVQEGCTFSATTTIGVFNQPSADITADAAICLTDHATVAYTGNAGANAVFTWDFGGGTAVPGNGAGPHQVKWSTAGPKTITLSVTEGSCTSTLFSQQVQVDAQIPAPVINCSSTTDEVTFTWNPVAGATGYSVNVTNGSGGIQTSDTSYVFSGLNPSQQVAIQVSVEGNSGCPLPIVQAACSAQPCPVFTVSVEPVSPICLIENVATVQLVSDVDGTGQSGSGTWSGDGVVDANLGIFDPTVAGVGLHKITFTYQQVNCVYKDEIDIEIVAPPTADAGPDRLLSCWESDQKVQLGGPGTSSGLDIVYQWTAASGSFPGNAVVRTPSVGAAGIFTLTVTNEALGCANSDEVLVVSTQSSPEPEVTVDRTYCGNAGKDAKVTVNNVIGGMDPYLYSLNGAPFVTSNQFPFLDAGDYTLTVMDAEGCTGTASFHVETAGELNADLTANIVGPAWVKYGESIQLTATVSLQQSILDSIIWTNDSLLSCTDCLTPLATPVTQTTFEVTVYKDGCVDSDSITIYVNRAEGQVYVPTAFSPNDDQVNDQLMIYGGPSVKRVKSFTVFDRWGEMVYKYEDFDPNDPARGWNGRFNGKPMNPSVFVWYAEVEYQDGKTELLEGDVTLVR